MDLGDQGEKAENFIGEWRTVSEGGNIDKVGNVVPDLMEPRGAGRKAISTS